MTKKKPIKKKLEIVFDPLKRKEFLTGFSKRKTERKKRAREELERNLKEERKRIRQEVKDGVKNLKKSFEPLRELTEEDKADGELHRNEDEYEDDDVKVKIVELTTAQLAKQRNFLGENQGDSTDEDDQTKESSDEEEDVNCIPGMDFDVTKNAKRKHNSIVESTNDGTEDGGAEQNSNQSKAKKFKLRGLDKLEVKSKKDLDRFTKKKMQNKLKQSKVFRMNERVQKRANQKKAKRERNNTLKSLPRTQRKKLKNEKSRYNKGRLINKKQMRRKKSD